MFKRDCVAPGENQTCNFVAQLKNKLVVKRDRVAHGKNQTLNFVAQHKLCLTR